MAIKKYTDWRGWAAGLWDSAIPAGMTAFITLVTTNGLESLGLQGIGINLKQAGAQVGIHIIIAAAKYIQAKPRPGVVEEVIETSFISKDPVTGVEVTQGSKQTTTTNPQTPIEPSK
jgi:hypothetical protein